MFGKLFKFACCAALTGVTFGSTLALNPHHSPESSTDVVPTFNLELESGMKSPGGLHDMAKLELPGDIVFFIQIQPWMRTSIGGIFFRKIASDIVSDARKLQPMTISAYTESQMASFRTKAELTEGIDTIEKLNESLDAAKQWFFGSSFINQEYQGMFGRIKGMVKVKTLSEESLSQEVSSLLSKFVDGRGDEIQRDSARRIVLLTNALMEKAGIRIIQSLEELASRKDLWIELLIMHKIADVLKLPRATEEFRTNWRRFYDRCLKA